MKKLAIIIAAATIALHPIVSHAGIVIVPGSFSSSSKKYEERRANKFQRVEYNVGDGISDAMLFYKDAPLYTTNQNLIIGVCESSWFKKVNCKTFEQLTKEADCELRMVDYFPARDEIIIYCRKNQQ